MGLVIFVLITHNRIAGGGVSLLLVSFVAEPTFNILVGQRFIRDAIHSWCGWRSTHLIFETMRSLSTNNSWTDRRALNDRAYVLALLDFIIERTYILFNLTSLCNVKPTGTNGIPLTKIVRGDSYHKSWISF